MPTFGVASVLFLDSKQGQFVGDPIEAIRSVAAGRYLETELMAEGVRWENGPPDPNPYRDAL